MRTIDQIRLEVEKYLGVKPGCSFWNTRKREITEARQLTAYFAYDFDVANFEQIGQYFGKGHSTILQGVKKIKLKYGYDKVITKAVDDLTGILGYEITDKDYQEAERIAFLNLIKKLKNETVNKKRISESHI